MDDGTRTHDGRNHNPGLYQLSYVHHRPSRPAASGGSASRSASGTRQGGAPGRTRTCDPRLRRPVLYPAELRAQSVESLAPDCLVSSEGPTGWSGQRDSNPRPSAPKADALPDCAMPRQSDTAGRRRAPAPRAANHTYGVSERQFEARRMPTASATDAARAAMRGARWSFRPVCLPESRPRPPARRGSGRLP